MPSECVCQGSNENCRFCFGSGFLSFRGWRKKSNYRTQESSSVGQDRTLNRCPVCGVVSSDFRSHLQKFHSSTVTSPRQQTGRRKVNGSAANCDTTETQENQNSSMDTAQGTQSLFADAKTTGIDSTGRCPRCLLLFTDRKIFVKHLVQKSCKPKRTNPVSKGSPVVGVVACSRCGVRIRANRLKTHLAKKCPARRNKQVRESVPERTLPTSRAARRSNAYREANSISAGDQTKGYGHSYRERGRFGSHPSHDGFDDESGPD